MIARRSPQPARQVRCAIYTRKSVTEGLEQEFNSLHAQRASAEAYIESQKQEGWVCLPDHYDDGGYTGANLERPGLQRLLEDIRAGRIDIVLTYKLDRLSRSLLDFARLSDLFDEHGVGLVSVTQPINSTDSMGRLMLNVILSFAQFEREMTSERTRDKIMAARKRGRYTGGPPILGYDIEASPAGSRLVVNQDEAEQVRRIFSLYLEQGGLLATVKAIDALGWTTKRWTTKNGTERGGAPFDKTKLHNLLTNVTYLGKTRYKDEVFDGEHEAIIEEHLWRDVQIKLASNGAGSNAETRNRHNATLRGLVKCAACGSAMSHTFSTKRNRRYRYYSCSSAQKRGVDACSNRSVSATDLEAFVIEQIRAMGFDRETIDEVYRQANAQAEEREQEIAHERRITEREIERLRSGIKRGTDPEHLADLHERLDVAQRRIAELAAEEAVLTGRRIDREEVATALEAFETIWTVLSPKEQTKLMSLLVSEVVVDKAANSVRISFHTSGLRQLLHNRPAAVA